MTIWIPCEKQLPNEDEIIWNSIGINGERKISDRVLAIDSTGFIRCGYFMKSCKTHKYCGSGKRNKYSDYGQASWEFGEHYQNDPKNQIVSCDADIIGWTPLEQKEKRGQWEPILFGGEAWGIKCSNCNTIGLYGKSAYCPNCGAKMENEK